MERINTAIGKFKESEFGELVSNLKDISDKSPVKKAEAEPGQLQPEQDIERTNAPRIPELTRAETVSRPIGLNLGSNREERTSLSFDQIKDMQRSSITDLVARLRTQRRLFG